MPLRDVRGQDRAVQSFQRAWATGKLHHAYLIEGPRGVGKTFLASEVGRLLVCDAPAAGPDACGACRSCGLHGRQSHPDVLLIQSPESKSTISVAQIRELRGLLDYPPHGKGHRAVIIRRADQMTPEAQNAFLKTLEEPPSRTHILLTTSRSSSLLPTVLSRCLRLRAQTLHQDMVLELLGQQLPDTELPRLRLAAALSQGSVASALEMLERDLDGLSEAVGSIDEVLKRRDSGELLRIAGDLSKDKPSLLVTLELLALWYRDAMVAASGATDTPLAYAHRQADVHRVAGTLGVDASAKRLQATLGAIDTLTRRNANARLTVESLLLRMLP